MESVVCPDLDVVLAPLKPFQRRTVDHAFHRLFEAADSTGRFLVADEVGLGKTLVARGIIGHTIEHFWDHVERIDIIYISGRADERAVLFHLLEPLVERRTALMNLMQGNVSRTGDWRWRLNNRRVPLDPEIKCEFEAVFGRRPDLSTELDDLLESCFARRRQAWPLEARHRRNRLIGRLRQLLAEVCVQALQPDLVILDEFQRFKPLLETREENRDPAAELAHALFQAKTPEGHPVCTLLLSATPYKLYTVDAEIEHEDHYEDFLGTTRFLMDNDETRVNMLKYQLSQFGSALKRAATGDPSRVVAAKMAVQATLQSVMARTERVAASEARDAMVEEPKVTLRLRATDTGTRSRHWLLLLPCLRLADEAHPLSAPVGVDRRIWVRERVDALLADPAIPDPADGDVDDRWEWAAPVILDPSLKEFLEVWKDDEGLPRQIRTYFRRTSRI